MSGFRFLLVLAGLGLASWLGLAGAGLGWAGSARLGWAGLEILSEILSGFRCFGEAGAGLAWTGLGAKLAGLAWLGLGWAGGWLGWAGLGWTGPCWARLTRLVGWLLGWF